MAISYTWFANANVTIKTTVVQAPSLNTCMLVGIFPDQTINGAMFGRFRSYSDSASFVKDFTPLYAAETNAPQKQRYSDLISAVNCFFNQEITPNTVLIGRLNVTEVESATSDSSALVTPFLTLKQTAPSWYGFTIVDNSYIPAGSSPTLPIYSEYTLAIANALSAMTGGNYKAVYFENTKDQNVFASMTAISPDSFKFIPNPKTTLVSAISGTDLKIKIPNRSPENFKKFPYFVLIDNERLNVTDINIPSTPASAPWELTVTRNPSPGAAHSANAIVKMSTYVSPTITATDVEIGIVTAPLLGNSLFVPPSTGIFLIGNLDTGELVSYTSVTKSTDTYYIFKGCTRGIALTTAQAWTTYPEVTFSTNTSNPVLANPAAVVSSQYASPNWAMFYHTQNYTNNLNFASAVMGAFFVKPKGKTISRLKLRIPADNLTKSQLDYLTDPTNGVFINCFAGFSNTGGSENTTGLVQYGHMVTSKIDTQYYLDQVYTADFAELQTEADLATYMINNDVYYDDNGIQQLVTVIKNTLNAMVTDNMLLPFENTAITYVPYAQVPAADIANRVYKGIVANVVFKSHIQKVTLAINITLV
jgi:hypothetical protein